MASGEAKDERNQALLHLKSPWSNNGNSIWLASSLRLQRNIDKFKFPAKLDLERKKQIVSLVGKELLHLDSQSNPKLLKAEELSVLDREYLVEHFLSMESFHQMGVGQGFVFDDSGQQLTLFNTADHLSFIRITTQPESDNSWAQLIKQEVALGKHFNYAFSPRFGFLTADLSKCGSAFTIAAYLQLPALIHTEKINTLLEFELEDSLFVTGIQGNPTEVVGDILVIQNNYTLGVTEEHICSSVRSFAQRLIAEENSTRLAMKHSPNPSLMDRVSRAFAVLAYSYQIEAVEALNAFSLLKLGVEMGWVEGCSVLELNQLFFNCRRAHLLYQLEEKISQEEISHKRAECIHKAIKNISLRI